MWFAIYHQEIEAISTFVFDTRSMWGYVAIYVNSCSLGMRGFLGRIRTFNLMLVKAFENKKTFFKSESTIYYIS
jgi:hypothetical protein